MPVVFRIYKYRECSLFRFGFSGKKKLLSADESVLSLQLARTGTGSRKRKEIVY